VEFLEFLGRIANLKYKSEMDKNLTEKIEMLLYDIFLKFELKLNEDTVQPEEYSESDHDY